MYIIQTTLQICYRLVVIVFGLLTITQAQKPWNPWNAFRHSFKYPGYQYETSKQSEKLPFTNDDWPVYDYVLTITQDGDCPALPSARPEENQDFLLGLYERAGFN